MKLGLQAFQLSPGLRNRLDEAEGGVSSSLTGPVSISAHEAHEALGSLKFLTGKETLEVSGVQ